MASEVSGMRVLSLLWVNFWTVLEIWALSLRRTLTFKSMLAFFAVGFAGTGLVTFVLHFLSTRFLPSPVVAFTLNPVVEESVKFLPVLLLWVWFRPATFQMGIADFLLLGLASGTGFEVAEALLYVLGGSPRIYDTVFWLPQQQFGNHFYFRHFTQILEIGFAGHGIMTAMIGAAMGLAFFYRLPIRKQWLLALPLAAGIWTVFDHIMINYMMNHNSMGNIFVNLSRPVEALYYYDQAGKLIVRVFTLLLFLIVVLEEWAVSECLAKDEALRLPEEKAAFALLGEVKMALQGFRRGWPYLQNLWSVFLIRRQIAFWRFRAGRNSADQRTEFYLLARFQRQVKALQQASEIPASHGGFAFHVSAWGKRLRRLTLPQWGGIAVSVIWGGVFIVRPTYWRDYRWFHDLLMALGILAAVQAVMAYMRFAKIKALDRESLDANIAIQFFAGRIMLMLGLVLSGLGVLAYFAPIAKIVNGWHTYFLWNAFTRFYNTWGLHLPGMLGVNAGLISSIGAWMLAGLAPSGIGEPLPTPTPGPDSQPKPRPVPTPTPFKTPQPRLDISGITQRALEMIGTPYSVYDCSGFVKTLYPELPRTANEQFRYCRTHGGIISDRTQLSEGDLIFFKYPNEERVAHVGYVKENNDGNITMIHSSNSEEGVKESIWTTTGEQGSRNMWGAQIFAGGGRVQ